MSPGLRFEWFPDEKKQFFIDLNQRIIEASVPKVVIQDTPGYRIRLLECKVCHEHYWLTDEYDNLDYCATCVPKIERLVTLNAYSANIKEHSRSLRS